ncbi:hypothetical protein J3F84DRAFT_263538 [Trichoderma pleuroticola]
MVSVFCSASEQSTRTGMLSRLSALSCAIPSPHRQAPVSRELCGRQHGLTPSNLVVLGRDFSRWRLHANHLDGGSALPVPSACCAAMVFQVSQQLHPGDIKNRRGGVCGTPLRIILHEEEQERSRERERERGFCMCRVHVSISALWQRGISEYVQVCLSTCTLLQETRDLCPNPLTCISYSVLGPLRFRLFAKETQPASLCCNPTVM